MIRDSKLRARFVLLTVAVCLFVPVAQSLAGTYYVDPGKGSDSGPGSEEQPFKSIAKAMATVDGIGGTVHLSPASGPYYESLMLGKGGLPDDPVIIEGHNSIINLGSDVTSGPWTKTENGWILELKVVTNPRFYVATPVFVNGLPVYCDHPKGRGTPAWHGGSVRYDEQGRLILVFPRGLSPSNSVVVLTGKSDYMNAGVGFSNASNVIVRDLTSAFAGNDGFNFHGNGTNVLLERCKGIFNGDQGMSSHEGYQIEARDCEIAFDGSQGAGIIDINGSITTYKNCRVHQNRGAGFQLQGKMHVLENIVVFGNGS